MHEEKPIFTKKPVLCARMYVVVRSVGHPVHGTQTEAAAGFLIYDPRLSGTSNYFTCPENVVQIYPEAKQEDQLNLLPPRCSVVHT